jgi:hypothetical protein
MKLNEIDPRWIDYCTTRQAEVINIVLEKGWSGAGKALGVSSVRNLYRAVEAARDSAIRQGYSPQHDMTKPVPDGFHVKGVSTYYDDDGNVKGQWVKSQKDKEEMYQQIRAFAEALADDVKGKSKKIPAPKRVEKDLLNLIPIGDPHLGMYAEAEEAGDDFNVNIACADLSGAVDRLLDAAPPAECCVILNLGDFFHADDNSAMTKRSGHKLDVDTRHERVMRMGSKLLASCVEKALEKHKKVIVRNNIGNHDDQSSIALSLILEAYFSNNPRVEIATSPNPFWYHRHGKVLIGSTHGHEVKPNDLPIIMANDRQTDWGETDFRYWHIGHFHTQKVHEPGGVVIEYARTLAAKDSWTNAKGYRSGRDLTRRLYHKDWGEVETQRVNIRQLR